MSKLSICILLGAAFIITSCIPGQNEIEEKPVARVYDFYLYPSDLDEQLPEGLGREDSMRIARRLIEEWIREKLLLRQAEIHLPENLEEIDKQVEEYRSALLVFKYKQSLLDQNLDSLISEKEISDYYDENSSNYVLEEDVVQMNYIKVPASAPQINNVRRWYRSDREDYLELLKEYCKEYGAECSINDTSWVSFSTMIANTPLNLDNPSRYLNYNRNIETRDSDYYHFIRIIDRKREGEVKPLSMVEENIRTVLINKRKLEYLQDLENSVYREGLSRNQAEVY